MPVPGKDELLRPVIEALGQGATTRRDVFAILRQALSVSDEDWEERIPSGARRFADRADWAMLDLLHGGLIERVSRGVFAISADGETALRDGPQAMTGAYLRSLPTYRSGKKAHGGAPQAARVAGDSSGKGEEYTSTPRERISDAAREMNIALADEMLTRLREGTSAFFERAVVALLLAMGYGRGREGAGRVLGRSGDGGIDGVINEDALGLDAVYVQAKRYGDGNTVGRPAIQQFVGSLVGHGATKGVFVTTSTFSREAVDYAAMVTQRVILIDGARFARLMIDHGVGVRTAETVEIREIDENFFVDD